jgi:hypothetical protein
LAGAAILVSSFGLFLFDQAISGTFAIRGHHQYSDAEPVSGRVRGSLPEKSRDAAFSRDWNNRIPVAGRSASKEQKVKSIVFWEAACYNFFTA